jgi:UDP-N-acetylmuramate--alanine ligase
VFVENIPFYGFAALCLDHPEVQAMIGRISDRRLITYGLSPQADVRGLDLDFSAGNASFKAEMSERTKGGARTISDLRLPMPGRHNVQNALAMVAVASELGISDEVLRRALAGFSGVKRRFTNVGTVGDVTVIDDYGHHPVEISAVLSAARQTCKGRVIAVVQPHRYTRLHDLFEDFCSCFNQADTVVVADVYAAGEDPIEGADRDGLVTGLRGHGHRSVIALDGPEALAPLVADLAREGDMVVCLGAGSISAWANALPGQLEELGFDGKGGGR